MYLSDSTLHSAIDGISRTLGIYVEVEGAEYAPASIIRLEWENECIDGSNFTIGGTLSNRIELEIYHDESILVGDQIKPSVEIEVEGEMIRIPLGIFYVDSVSVNKEITTLTAYDAMISLDKEYIPSANHTSLRALASDVCQQAGILMKGDIEDIPIARSLEGYSYRETLGFIASFHAGNMVVDRDGQFKIKTYEVVDRTIPNHAYFSFDQKDTYRVSAVMCNFGSIGIGRGDDTAQCVTFENPYVTEEHIDRIYLKLKDLTFVAGKLNYRGDMNLDAGDLFTLTDANGQDHLLLCGQNQLTFTGGLTGTLNSIGEGQGANQYVEYKFKNKKSITQLTVEMGKIQAEVSEVEKKLENDYSTTEETKSLVTQTATEISSVVARDEIQNLNITGVNLFRGTQDYQPTEIWWYENVSITEELFKGSKVCRIEADWAGMEYNLKSLLNDKSLIVGETYTMSVWAKTNGENCHGGFYCHWGNKQGLLITSEWQRFEWTFIFTQEAYDGVTNTNTIRFEPYNISGTPINAFVACWKLERGEVATDYQPSSQDYATTTQMSSAITQTATEISLTVAKKEIQNVQVGGTNLLTGTKTLTGAGLSGQIVEKYKGCNVIHESNNNGSGYKDVIAYGGLILEPSTEYTLSFWAKGGGFITSYLYADAVEFGYHHNFENRTTNKADGSMNTDLEEGTWKRYAITWKTKPNVSGEKGLIVGRLHGGIPNGWCSISAPKFEKGNKPTDWSESPLEYSTTTEMNSAITQKVDEINLSVSQTINNIQTGGKNLIKNGNFEDGLNHWIYERFSGVTTTDLYVRENDDWCMDGKKQCSFNTYSIDDSNRHGEWTVRQYFKTVVGQEYTISYMIAGHRSYKTVAVRRNDNWGYLASKDYGHIEGGKNANDWVYDSITFTATTSETMIWFIMRETMSGTNAHMWFTDVCCVEGNKAQRFIPSFEEYSTTTEMNSAITQKANEINLTVNKIKRGARIARWVRCYMHGNTVNSGNHIVQVQVWSNGTNLALGKIPYSNAVLDNPGRMTDGNLDTNSYAELHPNGEVYWEIDLGDEYPIDDITLWHYYGDSRRYHYVLATYDHNWEQLGVYNTWVGGTYTETSSGKNFVLNSSTVNNSLARIDIKADSITSRVESIDSNLRNNYTTKSELQQTKDDFKFTFQNSNGYNVLKNGNLKSGQDHWNPYWLPSASWGVRNDDWTGYVPCLQIYNQFGSQHENSVYQNIPTVVGKTYTVSAMVAGHRARNAICVVNGGGTYVIGYSNYATDRYGASHANDWEICTVTFVAPESTTQIRLVSNPMENLANNYGWFKEIQVEEGAIRTNFSPHPSEIYEGVTTIDGRGITVTHSGGSSYSKMSANGFQYYDAHANWNYHSLMYQGWLGAIEGTSWSRTITLPHSFRGKVFSVIVTVNMVNAVNTHDVVKHYQVTVPHNTVDYNNGTFVINMSALAYWVPGQGHATAIQTDVSWIAIA